MSKLEYCENHSPLMLSRFLDDLCQNLEKFYVFTCIYIYLSDVSVAIHFGNYCIETFIKLLKKSAAAKFCTIYLQYSPNSCFSRYLEDFHYCQEQVVQNIHSKFQKRIINLLVIFTKSLVFKALETIFLIDLLLKSTSLLRIFQ